MTVAKHARQKQKPIGSFFVLLPESLTCFTLAPSAPDIIGRLQSSVNIQSRRF